MYLKQGNDPDDILVCVHGLGAPVVDVMPFATYLFDDIIFIGGTFS